MADSFSTKIRKNATLGIAVAALCASFCATGIAVAKRDSQIDGVNFATMADRLDAAALDGLITGATGCRP